MDEGREGTGDGLRPSPSWDPGEAERLLPLVYRELHVIAGRLMSDQPTRHTLQPTALVHEAWMRLSGGSQGWEGEGHFLRVAARAMRHVLVDHARARDAVKRGRRAEVETGFFDQWVEVYEERRLDVLALHEALDRLAEIDEVAARVVELRYFAGLTIPEVARALEVSGNTVDRKWRMARVWLGSEIPGPEVEGPSG